MLVPLRSNRRPAHRGRNRGRSGLTIIEVLVTLVILMVTIGGYLQSLVQSLSLSEANRETALATEAVKGWLEDLQQQDFPTLFATYNASVDDDPEGPGTGVGPDFALRGFTASPEDPDGMPGELLFPTAAGDDSQLTENPEENFPFMPRDLNMNGNATDADVSADYALLPVTVRMQWRGSSGDRVLEISTLLVQR